MTEEKKYKLVLGVVGADVHIVGAKILDFALTEAGYEIINLGIMVGQQEFVDAAIESDADAILVSSVYGHGEIDCRGFRDRCVESGIPDILLLVGGNLVIGRKNWEETESIFRGYGFDKAYPPGTQPDTVIEDLRQLFADRASA